MIRKIICKQILHGSRPRPYIPYCQLCQQSSLGFCYNLWQSTIRDNNNIISNVSTVYSFLKLYYIFMVYPHQLDPVIMMSVTTNTQLGSLSHVPVRTDSLRVFLWGHVVISCSLACNTWSVRVIHCLLPTADLQPWRLAVCRFLVEAAAASSYLYIPSALASPSRVLLATTIHGIWTLTSEMPYLRTVPANNTELFVYAVGCSWLRTSAADHLINLCCHAGGEVGEQLFHQLR